uniref:SMB domain-containing protein n=1 Tax=Pelusios castaneus TaxID=367368 RepID=A0A8C8RVU6_9SAUR
MERLLYISVRVDVGPYYEFANESFKHPLPPANLTTLPFSVSLQTILVWQCLHSYCVILDVSSCAGRCGEGYSREADCQCDYNCQHFTECCHDYKRHCTAELSCKGRCFETFVRGQECDCDADCRKYQKCCPDYQEHCEDAKRSSKNSQKKKPKKVVEAHEMYTNYFVPDEQDDKNLCNGKPTNGIIALPNGTLAVFRGHYYWLLDSSKQPTVSPRKIIEGWGIPSPIDTVFSRCNCDGKIFFFKGSQYWRFTNDVKDVGYPKQIAKGFAGLNGKITAVLSVAQHNSRPESAYFFKRGGSVQHYIYNQEPAKKCKKKVNVRYPAYTPRAVIKRRRFERAIRSAVVYRTPVMHHTVRIYQNPTGQLYFNVKLLHEEVKINSYWRGFPKVVHAAISIPSYWKPDGFDYYVFSKDQYYNVNVASRTARSVTSRTGQTASKDWYKCPK